MPVRRSLAVGLVSLALPASVLVGTTHSQASDTAAAQALATSKVSLVSHPQLAQQGSKPTAASKAKSLFTGTVSPRKNARPITLQVKTGSKWVPLAKTKTKSNGSFQVTAPARRGVSYRVVAASFKGAKAATSASVTVTRWLKPTFSDEFNGRTLGSAWSQRGQGYQPTSSRACSKGSPKAVKVTGGALRLSVLKDTSRSDKCEGMDGAAGKYFAYRLNGHVGTQNGFGFRYGYAAARMKMQAARGPHSAFWLQPVVEQHGETAATAGTEIDVVEYFGDKNVFGGLTTFVYSHGRLDAGKVGAGKDAKGWLTNPKQYLANKKDGWSKNYHVFSVEWTPTTYIFRIDGQETWRTNHGVSGIAQYPILSLLSSDYALHQDGGDRNLPHHNYTDWIRVWETPQP